MLLLRPQKTESTICHSGIEGEDTLAIAGRWSLNHLWFANADLLYPSLCAFSAKCTANFKGKA